MDKKGYLEAAARNIEEVTASAFELEETFTALIDDIQSRIMKMEAALYLARYFLKEGAHDEE